MAKKGVKRTSSTSKGSDRIDNKVVENLIALQKIHLSVAEKFDKLSEQISTLLALFESSARSFATQPHMQMAEKDREFLDKIDKLLEQNKTIAKGLTLMEQRIRDKVYGPTQSMPPQQGPPNRQFSASQWRPTNTS